MHSDSARPSQTIIHPAHCKDFKVTPQLANQNWFQNLRLRSRAPLGSGTSLLIFYIMVLSKAEQSATNIVGTLGPFELLKSSFK